MKKELLTGLVFTAAYFLLITLLRNWFDFLYLPFWLGGVIGVFLPLTDYLIHEYILKSEGDLSDAFSNMTDRKSVMNTLNSMADGRTKHKDLIFHTAHFQLIFLVFTFWMMTSSNSLFGMGMALAFLLHLFVDQVNDFAETGTIENWFNKLAVNLNKRDEKLYLTAQVIFLVVFGFFI